MKKYLLITVSIFLAAVFVLGGCASTKKMRGVEDENARLEEENRSLRNDLDQSKKRIEDKDSALSSLEKDKKTLESDAAKKDEEIVGLRKMLQAQQTQSTQEVEKLKNTYDLLVKNLEKEIRNGTIQIEQIKGRLNLTIAEKVFFDTGSAEIKPEGQVVLRKIGEILKTIPEKNIRVEGHTDSDPIVSPAVKKLYQTNWELGSARATTVVRFLIDEVNVDPFRLSAVSYGQYRPAASNKNVSGKAKNRRIEIILIDRDLDLARTMRQYLR